MTMFRENFFVVMSLDSIPFYSASFETWKEVED
jgi:hypothetical protein